jgi:hypothetical protein
MYIEFLYLKVRIGVDNMFSYSVITFQVHYLPGVF